MKYIIYENNGFTINYPSDYRFLSASENGLFFTGKKILDLLNINISTVRSVISYPNTFYEDDASWAKCICCGEISGFPLSREYIQQEFFKHDNTTRLVWHAEIQLSHFWVQILFTQANSQQRIFMKHCRAILSSIRFGHWESFVPTQENRYLQSSRHYSEDISEQFTEIVRQLKQTPPPSVTTRKKLETRLKKMAECYYIPAVYEWVELFSKDDMTNNEEVQYWQNFLAKIPEEYKSVLNWVHGKTSDGQLRNLEQKTHEAEHYAEIDEIKQLDLLPQEKNKRINDILIKVVMGK